MRSLVIHGTHFTVDLLWPLILVRHVCVLIFSRPERGRILLYKLVNVLILAIDNHLLKWIVFPEFHLKEVNETSRLADFKSTRLIIMHAVPLSLSPDGQIFTSVNIDDLSSDFVSMLRCQMNNCMTNFLYSARSSHWIVVLFFLNQ